MSIGLNLSNVMPFYTFDILLSGSPAQLRLRSIADCPMIKALDEKVPDSVVDPSSNLKTTARRDVQVS